MGVSGVKPQSGAPRRRPGAGAEARGAQPFFVLGAQRSGTTMLRLMLNNHTRLCIPHETGFFTTAFRRLAEYGNLKERRDVVRLLDDIGGQEKVVKGALIGDRERILSRPIATLPDLIDAVMGDYAAARGKSRWGDKTPFYTPDIDILWTLFPDSPIVHLVRDGRDVALSQLRMSWLSGSVPRLAEDWRWKTTIAHKVGAVKADRFLEIRYEDLVMQPAPTLGRVCQFLGEDYEPEMLGFHREAAEVVPDDSLKWHRNSIRPPDPSKIGVWKTAMSRADRTIYEQIAGDALDLFGYEREHLASTLASRARALYFALVKRW